MDNLVILLAISGIHILIAFFITLSILNCPFRLGLEKFLLFLLAWLLPYIGSIIVFNRLGTVTVKNSNISGGSVSIDIPPNSSDNGSCGDSGDGCSSGD